MNLVDSSGWLEYFAEGRNAGFFAPAVENTKALLVSAINCYEVFRKIAEQRGEDSAMQAVAAMQEGTVVEVSADLAVFAATLALETKLAMADSIILATARTHRATIWTQDIDFAKLSGVKYVAKR